MKNYEKWDIRIYPVSSGQITTVVFGKGKYGGWYREAWEITRFGYDNSISIIHHFYNHEKHLAILTKNGLCRACNKRISKANRMFAELQLSRL